MAKSDRAPTAHAANEAADTPIVPAQSDFALSLEEFCARLSATDKRVELIGGFAHTERVGGNAKDTEAAYRARFAAFINQPA